MGLGRVMQAFRRSLPRALGSVLLAVGMVVANTPAAHAQWTGGGLNVTPTSGDQNAPKLAPDGAGGVYVAWTDARTDTGGAFLLRLDQDGVVSPDWPATGVRIGVGHMGDLYADGLGGVLITRLGGWHVLQVDASGVVTAEDTTGVSPLWLGSYSDARGGAIGIGGYLGNSAFYYLARIDRAGNVVWSGPTVVSDYLGGLRASYRSIVADAAGGAFATVERGSSAWWTLRLQHPDSTGASAPGWPGAEAVLDSSGGTELLGDVAPPVLVGSTGVVQLWIADHGPGGQAVRGRYIRCDGAMRDGGGNLTTVQTITPFDSPKSLVGAVARAGGGAISAWYDDTGGGSYLRFVTVDSLARPIRDNEIGGGIVRPDGLALVADGAGGAYAAWTAWRAFPGIDTLEVQHVLADGRLDPTWPDTNLRVCSAWGLRSQTCATVTGGALVLAWTDSRRTLDDVGAGTDIFVARITPVGVVPTRLALLDARAQADSVRLRWFAAGASASLLVERSADGVAWTSLSTVAPDGGGTYAFTDHGRAAGSSWAYRLAYRDGSGACPATWVRFVPGAGAEAPSIAGFVAGAATPALRVTLAGSAPATLEVYDVSGRRVASGALADAGAGERIVPLPGAWRAGVYFARLSQGGRVALRRAVLLR